MNVHIVMGQEGLIGMTEVVMKRGVKWPPKIGEYVITDKSIFLRCGGCKEILTIDHHTVKADGTISPSVVCPYIEEGCNWHVMMKLEDWLE